MLWSGRLFSFFSVFFFSPPLSRASERAPPQIWLEKQRGRQAGGAELESREVEESREEEEEEESGGARPPGEEEEESNKANANRARGEREAERGRWREREEWRPAAQ